jgi:4-deoxy-L-threo-5-hexosulose-uronate ketol-isomerase
MTSPRPRDVDSLTAAELRSHFLIENLFDSPAGGRNVAMTFTDLDRLALGGARPTAGAAWMLENDRETGSEFFLARRELGIINVGGRGTIRADGRAFEMENLDCLYVSMGSRSVSFESADDHAPAKFFLMSCPAHAAFATTKLRKADATPLSIGSQATANQRKIYQYIHAGGIKSAQLVMGFTELAEGSVWNTMPPHTHSRRSEIYFYFDMGDNIVSHFLGAPRSTRHVWVHNEQAVLSPSWSIHCGCGTAAYRFIWAMAGENQTFDDMDKVSAAELI